MAFIEKLDGPALNLSPEEFEGYMQRQRAPSQRSKRQQVASDTQHMLEELKGRQERLDQGMGALNTELHKWVQAIHSQVGQAASQFAQVQEELAAQIELSQISSSSSPQGEDEGQSVLLLKDHHAGPKDTDC